MKQTLLFFITLPLISLAVPVFDLGQANRAIWYNALAYCSYASIDSWDCGKPCIKNAGLKMITKIH